MKSLKILMVAATFALCFQTGTRAQTLFEQAKQLHWMEQDAAGNWFVVVERRSDGQLIDRERYYLTPAEKPVPVALKPELPPSQPPAPNPVPKPEPCKSAFREKHPVLYRVGSPLRWCWNGACWVGVKTEPIHPFLNLCGALGSCATPFTTGFVRR